MHHLCWCCNTSQPAPINASLSLCPLTRNEHTATDIFHPPKVYGDCEAASDDLFDKCADAATKKDCMAKKPDCDWDAEGTECYVSQAAILASILGDSHKAVADAKACHALTTAAACTGAGKLQYDIRLSKGYLAKHVTGAAPKTV